MKVIAEIRDNENDCSRGTIIQLDELETTRLAELIHIYAGKSGRVSSRLKVKEHDIDLANIFTLLGNMRYAANHFNRVHDEFEKLMGGIGE